MPAANLYSYDLDSLVFVSEQIVRARILPRENDPCVSANRLLVTKVFKGVSNSGDIVCIASMDFYRKPGNTPYETSEIDAGDDVVAFLSRPKRNFEDDFSKDSAAYEIVPSGLKVIKDDRTCGFAQQSNPGGYVMEQARVDSTCPEIGLFERQCEEAVSRIQPIARRLAGSVTKTDAPWLLQILQSRAGIDIHSFNRRDAIAEAVCARLAEVKDLPTLDQALRLTTSWFALDELRRGFGSREGREYILQRLSSPDLPQGPGRRESYAQALEQGIGNYCGSAAPGERFLERLGLLVVDLAGHGEDSTAAIVLSHLRSAASIHEQLKGQNPGQSPSMEPDLIASLNVLRSDFQRIRSPRLRFHVDELMVLVWPGLGFRSSVGPVVTLVDHPNPEDRHQTKPGHLTYEFSYASASGARGRQFQAEFILEELATHQLIVIPVLLQMEGGRIGSGVSLVGLPPELPRAKYRVFLRVVESGQRIGNGHGVELELPPP